jgi:predicted O-linked N-acetylglucosamine transferase (SPINDLY family)
MTSISIKQAMETALQHHRAGQLSQAEAIYRDVLRQQPDQPDALHMLGLVALQTGNVTAAADLMHQALAHAPNNADCLTNYGEALRRAGRTEEAVDVLRKALELRPDYCEAHNNCGLALMEMGRLADAVRCYERALEINPGYYLAHYNLGRALMDHGRLTEAISRLRKSLQINPQFTDAHTSLLLALNFHPDYSPKDIFQEHLAWAKRFAKPLKPLIRPHTNDPDPKRRLRIGYVSPDFRKHAVSFNFEPILAAHDHSQFEIFCYASVTRPDEVTRRLQGKADYWHDIVRLNDDAACNLIREHKIDILVDLAGHTANNRLLVFARKPAPVQATYIGYFNTTGLRTMDYRITDVHADPPGLTDAFYTEKLIRLPQCLYAYQPPQENLEPGSPPLLKQGHVTFGSFNNLMKIGPGVIALWARILHAVPNSCLVVKYRSLENPEVRTDWEDRFAKGGVDPARLQLLGRDATTRGHFEQYHRIDIALDPFPFNGGITTCDALWMGVPVVTLAGQRDTHMARMGADLLTAFGDPSWIATSPDEYVRKAADLAADRPRLEALRPELRKRVVEQSANHAARTTRPLEAAYRQMWITWCASVQKPS